MVAPSGQVICMRVPHGVGAAPLHPIPPPGPGVKGMEALPQALGRSICPVCSACASWACTRNGRRFAQARRSGLGADRRTWRRIRGVGQEGSACTHGDDVHLSVRRLSFPLELFLDGEPDASSAQGHRSGNDAQSPGAGQRHLDEREEAKDRAEDRAEDALARARNLVVQVLQDKPTNRPTRQNGVNAGRTLGVHTMFRIAVAGECARMQVRRFWGKAPALLLSGEP